MELLTRNDYEEEKVEVSDMLYNLPFNTSLSGYQMLTEAIMLALENSKQARLNMTKEVYGQIAKTRNINGNSVEKGIKLAIESVTSNLSLKELNCPDLIIKNALIDGRPKHFIMAVCEAVKLKLLKRSTNK